MLTLLRWAFWLLAFGALAYVAATVPLGSKTFVEHVRAIGETKAARDLATGTRDKAGEVAERMRHELQGAPATSEGRAPRREAPPAERAPRVQAEPGHKAPPPR